MCVLRFGKGLALLKFGIGGEKKKKEKVQAPARRQKFSSVSHQRVLFNNGGFTLAGNLNAEERGESLVQITAPYHSECPTCFALCAHTGILLSSAIQRLALALH